MARLRVTDYFAHSKAAPCSPEPAVRLLRSSRRGSELGRRDLSPAVLDDEAQRSDPKISRSPSQLTSPFSRTAQHQSTPFPVFMDKESKNFANEVLSPIWRSPWCEHLHFLHETPREKMELKPHPQRLRELSLEFSISDLNDLPKSLVSKGLDPEDGLKRAWDWKSKEDKNNWEVREIKQEQKAFEGQSLLAMPAFELLDREGCLNRVREIEARVQKLKAREEEQKWKAREKEREQEARAEDYLPPRPIFELLTHNGCLQRVQQIEAHIVKLKAMEEENWGARREEWKAKELWKSRKEAEWKHETREEQWLPPRLAFELLDRHGCLKRMQQIEAHVAKLKAQEEKKRSAREEGEWQAREREAELSGSRVEVESPVPEDAPVCCHVHTFAQDGTPRMSLPHKYTELAKMFCSMDTIVTSLFNQCETVTFAKVKQGVQDMTHKPFDENNMGQIKTVYPTAYHFSLVRDIPIYKDGVQKLDCQLAIEPLAGDGNDGQFCGLCLMERRHVFEYNLVDIVKQHHTVFLESLDPPVIIRGHITRWHPRFNVESLPEIPPADLPQPPQVNRLSTALEVLKKARKVLTPKLEKAFTNLTWSSPDISVEKKDAVGDLVSEGTLAGISEALKGIPKTLLDRIQGNESQKMQAILISKLQQEERIAMMSRLPDVARLLRNVFVFEKKPVLTMEVACNRAITIYHSSMTPREMEKHLLLLSELVPTWLSVHPVQTEMYLKLDNMVELGLVLDALGKKVKEEDGR